MPHGPRAPCEVCGIRGLRRARRVAHYAVVYSPGGDRRAVGYAPGLRRARNPGPPWQCGWWRGACVRGGPWTTPPLAPRRSPPSPPSTASAPSSSAAPPRPPRCAPRSPRCAPRPCLAPWPRCLTRGPGRARGGRGFGTRDSLTPGTTHGAGRSWPWSRGPWSLRRGVSRDNSTLRAPLAAAPGGTWRVEQMGDDSRALIRDAPRARVPT
jgi:hypothetical protein